MKNVTEKNMYNTCTDQSRCGDVGPMGGVINGANRLHLQNNANIFSAVQNFISKKNGIFEQDKKNH